jgi:3-isopropylmalate/(R)-2-methylmalate dehydratase small subunit
MDSNEISKLNGRGVYVQGNDIDTDRIIPARYLKCVTFDELGPALFFDERFDEDGNSKGHPLDDEEFKGADILISDANFGCGSSREHAPQAIQKFGIKAVIAESFAEIFQGNCTTLGIPCVMMEKEARASLAALVEKEPEVDLTIDLKAMQVVCANQVFPIDMKQSSREAFLAANYDPLDTLLKANEEIKVTAQRLGYL